MDLKPFGITGVLTVPYPGLDSVIYTFNYKKKERNEVRELYKY